MAPRYRHAIHFSLAEAQRLLPDVMVQLREIQGLKQQLDAQGYDIQRHRYFGGMGPNGLRAYPLQLEDLVRIYQELASSGIVLKDIDRGLIDFPTIRENGQEVYLCYLLGESGIEYWHGMDDGFAGRQRIDTL